MFPIVQIGPLAIAVPGLALLAGVWVALGLAEKEAARLNLDSDALYRLAFGGLVAGLIGARLAYVAHYLSVYASDPLSVFSLNASTLAPAEGAVIGLAFAGLYGARRRLSLRATLDALAPAVAVMGVAVAVAHAASGDAFGAPAPAALDGVPWSVYLWGEYRYPAQIYELLAALGVLGLVWRERAREPFGGFNFLLVAALSAAARIFLEAFRGDSVLITGGWRAAQVGGLVVLVACLVTMGYWGRVAGQN